MSEKSFILSSEGLKNIIKTGNEFNFYFGDRSLCMNTIFAEFLSPVVAHLHNSDPTINSISFKNPNYMKFDDLIEDDIIQKFHEICCGSSITINAEQSNKIRIISILIGNNELYHKIEELFPKKKNLTFIDKYLQEVETFESANYIDFDFDFASIFDFIAKNFCSIDKKKLMKTSKSNLFKIINNKNLKLKSEDSLFDFITEIFQNEDNDNDNNLIYFYEKIDLRNLSDAKFIEFLKAINPNEITTNLWENICNRFNKSLQNNESEQIIKYEYDGNEQNAFKGIIYNFSKECNGNVNDKGIVSVTASSEDRKAKHSVDLNDINTYFRSKCDINSWLMFDFKQKKIRPTHYSIRTKPSNRGAEHLKEWVIEGSNDKDNWKPLDSRKDIKILNGKSAFHTFKIQENLEQNEFYQYIRIRQTGQNWCLDNYLNISGLEYFGSIK